MNKFLGIDKKSGVRVGRDNGHEERSFSTMITDPLFAQIWLCC